MKIKKSLILKSALVKWNTSSREKNTNNPEVRSFI